MRGKGVRLCVDLMQVSARLLLCGALALGIAARAQTLATTVPLMLPAATVFDAQGNLYFVETANHIVRKVTSADILTTVAGNGVQGLTGDGGAATAAELDSPAGLALDSAGDLFIADSHNQRIREVVESTGVIRTIAGSGAAGFSGDGGSATSAQLDLPTALALDSAGNLFIADTRNHRIRRIAAVTGVITTVAGNGIESFSGDGGLATAAAIDSPNGLALDSAGDLFIADTHNGRVREVSATTGRITTIAGAGVVGGAVQSFSGDGGAATSAGLALPRGLTVDASGNLYLADSANHRIRRISPAGVITTVAGQGTEAFVGDGGSASAASLDSPRSVAISPTGLLTLADTENQRVRQFDAQTAPGPYVHTIAGLAVSSADALSLAGAAVDVYGSGSVTATLTSATNATGSVTLLDTSGGAQTPLGSASLSANSASFSTSALAAGLHSLLASYAGDASHGAATSSALAVTVTPLAITAAANSATIFYGQALPTLTGSLTGVLAQDAGKVAASFTTTAAALSTVGSYPIAATLTGSAASNYTVSVSPAVSFNIAQVASLTGLSASTNALGLGVPVTLTAQESSTTSGVPTGSITLLDGTTTLATLPLSSGAASFTTSSLAVGAHTLSASYSGDANFLPSSSTTTNVAVAAASDFTLTATGATTQSVPAGSAATYNFSVAMVGAALSSPITLAVTGVPTGSTASINPTYLPPGGAATSFTVTIQTPLSAMNRTQPLQPEATGNGLRTLLAILLLPAIGLARSRGKILVRKVRSLSGLLLAAATLLALATLATGCGDRVHTASQTTSSTSYTLTVTGTATGPSGAALQHSANVTLQVMQ
ncbi:MAG: Ig-like domain repeat protein [Acidobacteriaceae bacterium]|nr:Ig-like domain repeat protein [Acidobacteriaceae bacterium]